MAETAEKIMGHLFDVKLSHQKESKRKREMERANDILYKIHKTSYYFTVGAFTSYGAAALLYGICICLVFVTGAYVESPMLMITGLSGPFFEAKAIVEVYEEGRKLVRKRKKIEKKSVYRRKGIYTQESYAA